LFTSFSPLTRLTASANHPFFTFSLLYYYLFLGRRGAWTVHPGFLSADLKTFPAKQDTRIPFAETATPPEGSGSGTRESLGKSLKREMSDDGFAANEEALQNLPKRYPDEAPNVPLVSLEFRLPMLAH
jgi:hypothetical protein